MKKKLFALISGILVLVMLFASCGASEAYDSKYENTVEVEMEESYDYENPSSGTSDQFADSKTVKERMLVYDMTYTLETKTFDEAKANLEAKVTELGGYIESFNAYNGSRSNIDYTFRIPTKVLDQFTSLLEAQGNVTYKHVSVTDYTDTYYDYQTEIGLLETELTYIEGYLEEATDSYERTQLLDQVLAIKREISRLERESKDITEVVMYSTVHATLRDVESFTDIQVEYKDTLGEAFVRGWEGFFEIMQELLYLAVLLSPLLAILLVIIIIVVTCLLVSKKRAKKKAALKASQVPVQKSEEK